MRQLLLLALNMHLSLTLKLGNLVLHALDHLVILLVNSIRVVVVSWDLVVELLLGLATCHFYVCA